MRAPRPLDEDDELDPFDCGEPVLNAWLTQQARRNERNGASRTFVVTDGPKRVVAYYCLSTGAVARAEAPGAVRRNMPEPVPVMVLGRMAVDLAYRGRGIGRGLLKDAVLRTLQVASDVGVRALLVHAVSEEARRFYLHWGFHASPTHSRTLMLPLKQARAVFSVGGV